MIDTAIIYSLGWTLIHSIWQLTILAVLWPGENGNFAVINGLWKRVVPLETWPVPCPWLENCNGHMNCPFLLVDTLMIF